MLIPNSTLEKLNVTHKYQTLIRLLLKLVRRKETMNDNVKL